MPAKSTVWDSAKHFMNGEEDRKLNQEKQNDFYGQVKKAEFLFLFSYFINFLKTKTRIFFDGFS